MYQTNEESELNRNQDSKTIYIIREMHHNPSANFRPIHPKKARKQKANKRDSQQFEENMFLVLEKMVVSAVFVVVSKYDLPT